MSSCVQKPNLGDNLSRGFGRNKSFYVEDFKNRSVSNYTIVPYSHSGFKFVIKARTSDSNFNASIYGKVFNDDEWEWIGTYNSPKMEYKEKFLYYRKIKIVSKSGEFKYVKTKLFIE